ncbi:MAG: FtsX-like permease family protein [Rhodanobacter sp.]|nr:MAG: FtsX-like permease family protein [Rhodanobacter sp.]
MQIRPILASLRKHRIPAILIVLEIALACAVLCNAVFMIGQRVSDIRLPNAIDQAGLSSIEVQGTDPKQAGDDIPRNLAALRAIAGVKAVTAMNALPLTNYTWNGGLSTHPDKDMLNKRIVGMQEYLYTAGGGKALGLKVLQGRFFNADESAGSKLDSFMPAGHVVLITQSLARKFWPHGSAVGKMLYLGDKFSYTVVGVVADVLRPNRSGQGEQSFYYSAFFPLQPNDSALSTYVVRSAPADRDRVLREGIKALSTLAPNAVVKGRTFSDIRDKYFADMRSMAWMLVLVCAVMLAVTAFGIVGLTSFWVGQRRRQIGIRRAVGATRGQILGYFRTENFLLSTAGVLIGMLLAFGINLYLMQHYEMSRMPWYYLPTGAVTLWLLGQLAVLGPALRAASVSPVEATRSA